MQQLFAWYNLVFIIPIVIGVILIFSAGMGVDGDIDADADADVDADGDVEEAPVILKALTIIGIGRCPLSIVILSALLIFGGTGLILNQIFAPLLAFVSVIGAFFSMLFFTRLLATIISKLMPTTETYVVGGDHLVGLAGKIVLKTTTEFGQAHVFDHHGGLHKVQCRTYQGELPVDSDILIVDRKGDIFYVDKDPGTEESNEG
jgi:hypothetical protein